MVELDPRYFPKDPDFVVADLGPGGGGMTQHLDLRGPVVPVEIDEELAAACAALDTDPKFLVCRGDAHQLPLRDASVDGVLALEMLEHVDDPDRVLAEAHRILRPGGALGVAVPTSYTERFYSRVHPRYLRNATHVRIFDKADLLERLARAGFVGAEVRPEHFEPMLAWVLHSFLRSDAHPTGLVLEHQWVEPKVARAVARLERTPGARRVVRSARGRLGKSWYVYARKPADTAD